MNKPKVIKWKKFIDPFEIPSRFWENENLPESKVNWDNKPYEGEVTPSLTDKLHIILTNIGPIPLVEHSVPSKVFNFWVGHTNFPIDEETVELINDTLGVESLEIYSPLRMRVSIGLLFEPNEVFAEIQRRVNEDALEENPFILAQSMNFVTLTDADLESKVIKTKDELSQKYKYWAMFVLPNGSIDIVSADDINDPEFSKAADLYLEMQYKFNGLVLTSFDDST